MEDQCSPLSWGCFYVEEGIEELKHSLLYTSLELETTILSAHEEIARKEEEIIHLRDLLTKTTRERNEFQEKCQMLELEKEVILLQQQGGKSDAARSEEKPKGGGGGGLNMGIRIPSPVSTENYPIPPPSFPPSPPPPPPLQLAGTLVPQRALPENGKFLKAVMEAGPLLQTLLLAGPLPQWQHPPPQLNSLEIPPVTISSPPPGVSRNGSSINKRAMVPCEASDSSSPNTKYQKVVHQSPLTN